MINWQTILSSFDDKPTLMQWLKIVEKELQNAENENKLFVHNLVLADVSGGTIKVRVISKLATAMSFEYLYDNFGDFIFVPRIMGSDDTTNLLIQFARDIGTHTITIRGWKLKQNTIGDYTLLSKVNSDTVSELK